MNKPFIQLLQGSLKRNQFNIKNERSICGNFWRISIWTIRERARNVEGRTLSQTHGGNTLVPTFDYLTHSEREFKRHVLVSGRIKLLSVD